MNSNGQDGEGTNGAGGHAGRRIVFALEFDTETYQVSIGGEPMPISLAQMICGEGLRVLEEARRLAAIQIMQKAVIDNARSQEIVRTVYGRR